MGERMLRRCAGGLVLSLGLAGVGFGQTVGAVPKLDMDRFTGTWYQLAYLPNKREKQCVRDAVVQIALADKPGSFELVTACQNKLGFTEANSRDGKEQDKSGDGKMKVRTIWPFSKRYNVLALGPDYAWSLVGSVNHKELWVLSRTAEFKPEVLAAIEATAAAQGFAVGKLVMPPQSARYETY